MGKITVKHYLNTKIKPHKWGNDYLYPLYVQMTVTRKTTQIKSLTNAIMTKEAFETYYKTGTTKRTNTKTFPINEIWVKVETEVQLIEASLDILIERKVIDSVTNIKEYLESMLRRAISCLIKDTWEDYYIDKMVKEDSKIDHFFFKKETREFIEALNSKNKTLIENIKNINRIANVNLEKHIPNDLFKVWQTVELTKFANSENITLTEFVKGSYKKQITQSLKNKEIRETCLISEEKKLTDTEAIDIIETIIDRYILYCTGFAMPLEEKN